MTIHVFGGYQKASSFLLNPTPQPRPSPSHWPLLLLLLLVLLVVVVRFPPNSKMGAYKVFETIVNRKSPFTLL